MGSRIGMLGHRMVLSFTFYFSLLLSFPLLFPFPRFKYTQLFWETRFSNHTAFRLACSHVSLGPHTVRHHVFPLLPSSCPVGMSKLRMFSSFAWLCLHLACYAPLPLLTACAAAIESVFLILMPFAGCSVNDLRKEGGTAVAGALERLTALQSLDLR